MEMSLPSQVDFSRKLPNLPESYRSTLVTVQTTNGTSFKAGQVAQWDLTNRVDECIDPKSIFFRYRLNYTSGSEVPTLRGTPCVVPFFKLDEYAGSQVINSVYNYHQVANMNVNTNYSVADKYGRPNFGFDIASPTLVNMDSQPLLASQAALAGKKTYSSPLFCSALASATNFIPTGLSAPYRICLTLNQISEMLVTPTVPANSMTDYTIDNLELCYISVSMPGIDNIIRGMGQKIYLKTTCFSNAGQNVPTASSGVYQLPFNHRYRSIENIYLLSSGANSALSVNGSIDSYDITGSNGSVQFTVGSTQYPQLPIDTLVNKSSVMSYLSECVGSPADSKNTFSINAVEFNVLTSVASTAIEPAKCYFGVPLSKIQQTTTHQNSLMSGVDASNVPIIASLRLGTATGQAFNVYMVAEYTSLIEIDTLTSQVVVIN